jgi:predicted nuclease of predicted toxin-antitoxin system
MKFLVDAQLPRRVCAWLIESGHDAVHTMDLAQGNRTPDSAILDIADRDGRTLITKDADFIESYFIAGRPQRLLIVSTGNTDNADLERLLRTNIAMIVDAFESARLIEIGRDKLTVHE